MQKKGRSKSFCRTFKKSVGGGRRPSKKKGKQSSHKKSLHKSRVSKDKTPNRRAMAHEQFSPSIKGHNESDEKGLISKTINSHRKYRHNNQDYVKFLDVGKQFIRDGLYSSALDCLQRAILLEPHELEAHYLLGVTLLVNDQLEEAEQCFLQLIGHPQPKKNVFLLLAVCLKKQGRCDHLEQLLSECIRRFPKYYEAYAYRAKIRTKLKQLEPALQDFDCAIKLSPANPMGYIGKGDALRLLGRQEEALAYFAKAADFKLTESLLLKQALCRLEMQHFGEAMALVQQALDSSPQNSQALFLKALIFQRNRQFTLAITFYEQAILEFTNKKAVAKSFYEIIKINIEERDYYEAVKTAERVGMFGIEEKTLSKFVIFLEGVYLLRKKEVAAALAHFGDFEKNFKAGEFLKPLLANFKACAYILLSDYQEAHNCLSYMEAEHYLDNQSHYNLLICSGILAASNYKYEQAVTSFACAMSKAPARHEPPFYMAMTLMKYNCRHFAATDVDKKEKYQTAAFNYIEKALKIASDHHALLYHRAVFLFHRGELSAALRDTSKALKQASTLEQPIARILYLRGLLYAGLNSISKAIEDFSSVLLEDRKKEFPEAHLNRAKCLLFYGDKEAALADLQSYISSNPSDPAIHQWTGIVFYHFKSYEESIRAYSNTINIKKNEHVLRLRADAYLASKQIKSCIDDLRSISKIRSTSELEFDVYMLEAIKASLVSDRVHFETALSLLAKARETSPTGIYFSARDISFYQGIFLFFLGDSDTAVEYLKKTVSKKGDDKGRHAELAYNIAICLLVKGEAAEAIKLLEEAGKGVGKMDAEQIRFLIERVAGGQDKKSKKESIEEIQIQIFSRNNKLSNVYPIISLPVQGRIMAKLSFCLPTPDPVTIAPEFQPKLFDSMSPSIVEPVPELPWVNKSRDGIVTFTEEVMADAAEILFTEVQQEEENEDELEEFQEELNQGQLASSSQLADLQMPARQDVRNFLKLDDSINDRLNKLLHN